MAAFDNPHSLLYSSGVLSHGTTRLSALKSRRGNCEHSHTPTTCDAMLLDGVVTTKVSTPDHVRLCCCWSEVSACRNCVCVRLLVFVVFVRSCMVLSWSRVHCTDSTFGFCPQDRADWVSRQTRTHNSSTSPNTSKHTTPPLHREFNSELDCDAEAVQKVFVLLIHDYLVDQCQLSSDHQVLLVVDCVGSVQNLWRLSVVTAPAF